MHASRIITSILPSSFSPTLTSKLPLYCLSLDLNNHPLRSQVDELNQLQQTCHKQHCIPHTTHCAILLDYKSEISKHTSHDTAAHKKPNTCWRTVYIHHYNHLQYHSRKIHHNDRKLVEAHPSQCVTLLLYISQGTFLSDTVMWNTKETNTAMKHHLWDVHRAHIYLGLLGDIGRGTEVDS